MRKFATYIEYLLMTRHYCYVPGRGAYMLGEEPATMGTHPCIGPDSRRMHKLEAPKRVIRFSPLHHHDDGLLASLLMEAEGMTYDEACRYIERQVALLPEDFHESASLHTDTENFGYGSLMFETWGDIEARLNAANKPAQPAAASTEKKDRDADIIAIPRYWAQRAAVAILIAVCFFASFLGLDDQQTQQQYANVIDLSLLQRGAMTRQQTWEDTEDIVWTDDEDSEDAGDHLGDIYAYRADEYEEEDETLEDYETSEEVDLETSEDVDQEASEEVNPEVPAVVEEPIVNKPLIVAPNGKLYYIIVASCPDMKDAERALNNLQKQGYNGVGILERDDRCRLYINRFGDKTEAEAYLKTLRQDSNFSTAWLLPVREASLSIIIKNTYDDNQLFMELSHPNKRTERDQG